MTKIKTGRPSSQIKLDAVRRTRGRNYSASLRLEGFTVSTVRNSTPASVTYKEEVIAKYKQPAC